MSGTDMCSCWIRPCPVGAIASCTAPHCCIRDWDPDTPCHRPGFDQAHLGRCPAPHVPLRARIGVTAR